MPWLQTTVGSPSGHVDNAATLARYCPIVMRGGWGEGDLSPHGDPESGIRVGGCL